ASANGLPPSSPSNSFRVFPPPIVTFSPSNQLSEHRFSRPRSLLLSNAYRSAFCNPFVFIFIQEWGWVYPPHPVFVWHESAGSSFSHRPKFFTCNIYGTPRKCCKQKTYTQAKLFRCSTYKKTGVLSPRTIVHPFSRRWGTTEDCKLTTENSK